MPARLERRPLGNREERRLGASVRRSCAGSRADRRSPVAASCPRSTPVEQDLEHGRDDRRPARRAEREERLAVPQDDRRSHRAARPLAALDSVRMSRRVEVEVGQLVVEQEPVARDDEPGAAGRLDRERVRDDVAPACRTVRGASSSPTASPSQPRSRRVRVRIARRDRARRRGRRDQRAPRRRVPLREQAAQRDVEVGGSAR